MRVCKCLRTRGVGRERPAGWAKDADAAMARGWRPSTVSSNKLLCSCRSKRAHQEADLREEAPSVVPLGHVQRRPADFRPWGVGGGQGVSAVGAY